MRPFVCAVIVSLVIALVRPGLAQPAERAELVAEAQGLVEQGDHAGAAAAWEHILERDLDATEIDWSAVFDDLSWLGELYWSLGDYPKTAQFSMMQLQMLDRADAIDANATPVLTRAGLSYVYMGQPADAEPLLQIVVQLDQSGGNYESLVSSLSNLALAIKHQGRHQEARELYEAALGIADQLGRTDSGVAMIMHNLSTLIYETSGDFRAAEEWARKAIAILEQTGDYTSLASVLSELSVLYAYRGANDRALEASDRALELADQVFPARHPMRAQILVNAAMLAAVGGDRERSTALLTEALEIRRALNPDDPAIAQILHNLAQYAVASGELDRADELDLEGLRLRERVLGPEHPAVAISLMNLAYRHLHMREDPAAARPLLERALAIRTKALGPDHHKVAQVLDELARLEVIEGRIPEAIELAARVQALRAARLADFLAVGSENEKREIMTYVARDLDWFVSLAAQRAPDDPRARDLAATAVLLHKGRIVEATADQLARLRDDPAAQELLQKLRSARQQLAESGDDDRAGRQASVDELERKLADLDPELKAARTVITLEGTRERIPAAAVLVELIRYAPVLAGDDDAGDRYGAFVLHRERPTRWIDLGPADAIDPAVVALRRALATPRSAAEEPARDVYRKVWQPLTGAIGDSRFVLVAPDGALNLVPFAALMDGDGRYLIETHLLHYLASGRDLLRDRATTAPRSPAAVIASPAFGSGATPDGLLKGVAFQPLPGTAAEAEALHALLPDARMLLDQAATESGLAELEGPRLLHIATHGFFLADVTATGASGARDLGTVAAGDLGGRPPVLPEDPMLRSGLVFAGAATAAHEGDDGVLTALEASSLDLRGTRMVVLSACETGVGEVVNGDGVYGLRRALRIAGAESQVMSLWKVDDAATKTLMVDFYRAALAGAGRGHALRDAQLTLLTDRHTAHPYYWASFIASGDWRDLDGGEPSATIKPVQRSGRGCGCSGSPPTSLAPLALSLLLVFRRRRCR